MSTMHHPPVPKAPRKTSPASDENDLRLRLLRAASELVDEHGARGVTLRAVGDAASVSRTAPYLCFADREALLAAVAAQGLDELRDSLERAARKAPDPFAKLRAMACAYVEYAAAHPQRFRLMFGAEVQDRARHAALEEAGRRMQRLFSAPLEQAGQLVPHAQAELQLAQLTAFSVVHGLAHLIVDGRGAELGFAGVSPRKLTERVVGLLTRAVVQSPADKR